MTGNVSRRGPNRRHFRAASVAAVASILGLSTFGVLALSGRTAEAATVNVANCNDSGAGSLRAAIALASSGDVVSFSVTCSAASPITLDSTLSINQAITIDGPGAASLVISGNNTVEPLSVAGGVAASISGLTVEDGNAANDGGAITNAGSLTMTGVVVSDSSADFGGGIYNSGQLSLIQSTVSGNSATNGWGGGVLGAANSTTTVTQSTVQGNSSSTSGGGLFNYGNLTVTASTVSGNKALAGDGAGIYNFDAASLTVTDSAVSGNASTFNGGGIVSGGPATITNSTIYGNTAVDSGGGLVNGSSVMTLSNSTLDANSAPVAGNLENHGTLTVSSTIVAAGGSGGDCSDTSTDPASITVNDAGYNLADDATCGLTSTTSLSNTQAGLDPSGLGSNGGPTQTVALEIGSPAIGATKSASLCSTPDQRGVSRSTPCDMGAYQVGSVVDSVTNCNGTGPGSLPAVVAAANAGDTIGFSINCPASSPIALSATISIDSDLTIAGPGAAALFISGNGAVGVFNVASGAVASISGVTIEKGFGANGGGGIYNEGTLTLAGSTMSGNAAVGSGGAIANNGGTLNVTNSIFEGNSAPIDGGAIENSGSVTITNSLMANNRADGNGGGMENGGSLAVANSTIYGNSDTGGGAAIFTIGGSVSVIHSTLSHNSNTETYYGILQDNCCSINLQATIIANNTDWPALGLSQCPSLMVATTFPMTTLVISMTHPSQALRLGSIQWACRAMVDLLEPLR